MIEAAAYYEDKQRSTVSESILVSILWWTST